jgi:hypothetical protein
MRVDRNPARADPLTPMADRSEMMRQLPGGGLAVGQAIGRVKKLLTLTPADPQ